MSTTYPAPIVRPPVATIVEVYLPCLADDDCDDLAHQIAEVVSVDATSIDLRIILEWDGDGSAVSTANKGTVWTLFDQEQAEGHAIVTDPLAGIEVA